MQLDWNQLNQGGKLDKVLSALPGSVRTETTSWHRVELLLSLLQQKM
jgi:hypothetical protein